MLTLLNLPPRPRNHPQRGTKIKIDEENGTHGILIYFSDAQSRLESETNQTPLQLQPLPKKHPQTLLKLNLVRKMLASWYFYVFIIAESEFEVGKTQTLVRHVHTDHRTPPSRGENEDRRRKRCPNLKLEKSTSITLITFSDRPQTEVKVKTDEKNGMVWSSISWTEIGKRNEKSQDFYPQTGIKINYLQEYAGSMVFLCISRCWVRVEGWKNSSTLETFTPISKPPPKRGEGAVQYGKCQGMNIPFIWECIVRFQWHLWKRLLCRHLGGQKTNVKTFVPSLESLRR